MTDGSFKQPEVWQVVSIVTCVLLITTGLAVIARLATKYAISKRLHLDDISVSIALLSYVGSGTSVLIGARHGLGLSIDTITLHDLSVFEKSLLATELLFIVTVLFAKLSIVILVNNLTIQRSHRRLSLALGSFTIVWSLACLLAAAFACRVPETWNLSSRCYDKAAFWYAYGSINVATDIAFIALPTYIAIPLRMTMATKLMILGCFGSRLCDVIATVIQLTHTDAFHSSDLTMDLWPWILVSQVVQCITIITSCVPYLKPLLVSFPSGLFMSDEIRRKVTGASRRRRRFALHSVQSRENNVLREPLTSSNPFPRSNGDGPTQANITTTVVAAGGEDPRMNELLDRLSLRNPSLIMKSTTFSVSSVPGE